MCFFDFFFKFFFSTSRSHLGFGHVRICPNLSEKYLDYIIMMRIVRVVHGCSKTLSNIDLGSFQSKKCEYIVAQSVVC